MSLAEYHSRTLQMFGFSQGQKFESLIKENRYLYRVHDAKSRTPLVPGTGFVADKLQDLSQPELEAKRQDILQNPSTTEALYHARMSESTSYIGTTFSLSWAIWEANQRTDHRGYDQVKITVIDGHLLGAYASTAVTLLTRLPLEQRSEMFENFASIAQEVLVYAFIPEEAILATMHWDRVLPALPSWYREGDKLELREGKHDQYYPTKRFKARSRFEAFVEAFNALKMGDDSETAIHLQSIRLAIAITEDSINNLTSVVDIDLIENNITDIAAEICRWPSRRRDPLQDETKMWERKHAEIRNLVRLDRRLAVMRARLVFEESVDLLSDQLGKIKELVGAIKPSDVRDLQKADFLTQNDPLCLALHKMTQKVEALTTEAKKFTTFNRYPNSDSYEELCNLDKLSLLETYT